MIEQATMEFLSHYTFQDGEPVFVDESDYHFEDEVEKTSRKIIVFSGCLQFTFDVVTNTGTVTHNYKVDDVAEPGSSSPVVFYERSEELLQAKLPSFSCPHLESAMVSEQLFAFARFLAPSLSEGDILDGIYTHDPDYAYLDLGYDADVAQVIASLLKDIFSKFVAFDCECAEISTDTLENLSDTFR